MQKGRAKDSIRNGLILLGVVALALFLLRGLIFNYILGPHAMSLSDVRYPDQADIEEGDYVTVKGRAERLPVSEYISGARVTMKKQEELDYTQTDYYLLIGPESEIYMKTTGMQKLAADSTVESVFGEFPGILRKMDWESEEGVELAAIFEGPASQRPGMILDGKADITVPRAFTWLLLALTGFVALRGAWLIARGWMRLRQP